MRGEERRGKVQNDYISKEGEKKKEKNEENQTIHKTHETKGQRRKALEDEERQEHYEEDQKNNNNTQKHKIRNKTTMQDAYKVGMQQKKKAQR